MKNNNNKSESIGVTFFGNKNDVTVKLDFHKFSKCTLFYVVTYVISQKYQQYYFVI